MSDTRYLSVTETAKLIRKVLKREYPVTKFSVRSDKYAGGASIDISWLDGPTSDEVDGHVKSFAGKGFDGMIDMAYYKTAYLLADGTAAFAETSGTEGSGGSYAREKAFKPEADAERVRFGADYVSTNRSISAAMTERAIDHIHRKYGGFDRSAVVVREGNFGSWIEKGNAFLVGTTEWSRDRELSTMVYRHLARRRSSVA